MKQILDHHEIPSKQTSSPNIVLPIERNMYPGRRKGTCTSRAREIKGTSLSGDHNSETKVATGRDGFSGLVDRVLSVSLATRREDGNGGKSVARPLRIS